MGRITAYIIHNDIIELLKKNISVFNKTALSVRFVKKRKGRKLIFQ
ncbi:hypothetical protein LEP1GSC193_0428 [Leptospira alstonii serovar Pingchang str. 80-412]|uniref:Uncharacterized protein n=2 Tax=Leptospira alstonii TaxID=28452 RepID=M6CQA0_9LEPT|nr:hypothetical protein LEP1GSC194_1600 [Leptospira alstonii serovar Sichuan str. 79601]EQA79141.1 hypothetical protein LEP1GSC193_0428 [Leptospira alstonii serovar Pingchang str. 80-412]